MFPPEGKVKKVEEGIGNKRKKSGRAGEWEI
jgi:hypothetical protein